MVVHYKSKFKRDVREIKDKEVSHFLIKAVHNIELARNSSQIQNLIKLKEYSISTE